MSADAPEVPDRRRRWLRLWVRWTLRLAVVGVLLVVTGLFAWAWRDRGLPDVEAWHRAAPEGEFSADMADEEFSFDDYLALEERMFGELSDWMIPAERASRYLRHSRFQRGGPSDPAGFERNWNRSVELVPETIRGGALLIHGLSDSPYSFRTLAELLRDRGIYVLAIRLPGHGTVPAGLLDVTYEDWRAAVDVAARHVVKRIGEDRPFYVAGFSCGGALATQLVVDAVADPTLPVPEHVFLFSPAIGITAFARTSNWHKLFSWMPLFEKSKWLSIQPEYDPFKYNSFTKNAGAQMWRLTQAVKADLARVERAGLADRLPPVLAFQSVADATIVARDVVDHLFARLPANGSELVLFDVNDDIFMGGLYSRDPRAEIDRLERMAGSSYSTTVITNHDTPGDVVVARTTAPGAASPTTTEVGLAWPVDVYSLSHVAIPLPPDDELYGYLSVRERASRRLPIGRLALRGEKDVLRIAPAQLLRLRANPFHAYMLGRIEEALDAVR